MNPVFFDVLLALPPFAIASAPTWRLVWPRWKLFGKTVAYVGGVAVLSMFMGHWSVLLGWLHQGLGLGFHLWFCRKHGFTCYAVEDPDRYVALSKRMVGVADGES